MIPDGDFEYGYRSLVQLIGPGFHPDNRGSDYRSLPDGITPEIVDRMNNLAAHKFDLDMYTIALEEINAMQC